MPTEFDPIEAMKACEKPFSFEEHGFIKKNNSEIIESVYILKDAIRRRLWSIDAKYQTLPPEMLHIQGNVITMGGTMIFLGASRTSVGTGIIQTTKRDYDNNRTVELEGYELDRQIAKTIKTANTDLIARLALEWNIGSYLRPLPKTVKKEEDFRKFLEGKVQIWEARYAGMGHWAANGKGTLFNALVKEYGLSWNTVRAKLEPGRTLNTLRDITLTDVQAMMRLAEIKAEMSSSGGG